MSQNHVFNNRFKRAKDNPDHARRRNVPAPSDTEIEQRLKDLVQPAVFAELAYYQQLGLRNRLLTLPVMVAIVLAMIWRQIPGVCTLQRVLARERVLWAEPMRVSQPALSERFLTFPAELFERVLMKVLDQLPARLAARTHPQPLWVQQLRSRFPTCFALDGTTLEALFRKVGSLRERPEAPLAGHLAAVVDLVSHVPVRVWFAEDSQTNDKAFLPEILAWLPGHSLVVFDLGYFSFPFFDALTQAGHSFVTRLRDKTSFTIQAILVDQGPVRDRLVHLGKYRSNPSHSPVRLIEVQVGGTWRSYLTNVLDPAQLSVNEVVHLYEGRWQIETAFLLVKRLLGLSYLWVGSLNGVQLQVWATWLYYAVLIDLCEEVAQVAQVSAQRISIEMVSRSLYFYAQAVTGGYAGSAAAYLADPANRDLGIFKRVRRLHPTLAEQLDQIVKTNLTSPQLP